MTGPGRDPSAARLVFDDIPRFWTAFDRTTSATDTMAIRRDYLDAGSVGLRDFTAARWKNAKTLAAMVWPHREYYAAIRATTSSYATTLEPEVRGVFSELARRYPSAVFPDVYFAIGGMSTGGTTAGSGLLIGSELFSAVPGAPTDKLTAWERSVIRPPEILPAIVAHELTHYQQRTHGQTLLEKSINEGSADFVAELLTGRTINEHLAAYGAAHERELWVRFQTQMNGTDLSDWLYNGGSVTDTSTVPADLGYFIGYRITQAYWASHPDQTAALRAILQVTDFKAFLAASGYDPR